MASDHLDKKVYEMQADLCKALANPIRVEIIDLLKNGGMSVTELATIVGVSQANLSQHLAILRAKDIVRVRRRRGKAYYYISSPRIIEACTIVRQILQERLLAERSLLEKKL